MRHVPPEHTAKKRCAHAYARSTLGHGIPHLFLAAPLACAAVTIHVGSCEKRLRDGKLATSSYVFRHVLLGRRQALCPVEPSEACWHWEVAETFAPLANTSASSLLSSTRWRISGSRSHGV